MLSGIAFGLLALVAELAGRSLTHRIDVGRHVAAPSYAGADYYPFLLAAVKVGIALLLARLAWRFVKARAAARAARRVLTAMSVRPAAATPRMTVRLSPRLWLLGFLVTATMYLVQVDAEGASAGREAVFGPWLHTSALPVFAVLAVLIALAWGAVARWLADYESYAEATVALARSLASREPPVAAPSGLETGVPPRRLFGLAFESRPPPLPA